MGWKLDDNLERSTALLPFSVKWLDPLEKYKKVRQNTVKFNQSTGPCAYLSLIWSYFHNFGWIKSGRITITYISESWKLIFIILKGYSTLYFSNGVQLTFTLKSSPMNLIFPIDLFLLRCLFNATSTCQRLPPAAWRSLNKCNVKLILDQIFTQTLALSHLRASRR